MDNVKKLLKILPQDWVAEAEGMDEAQLRNVVVESTNNIRTAQAELAENEDYVKLKEALKEVSGPTKDALKFQRAKISYSLLLLESKGKL